VVRTSLVLVALLSGSGFLTANQTAAVTDNNPQGLEGRPAPRIDGRGQVGPRVPSADELKGRVVLLFFWAHWCADCKPESPIIAKMLAKYRTNGLTIIAPTRQYGFVENGRPAQWDRERRYLLQVRDAFYPFLRDAPVPTSDTNYSTYGIDSIPTYVLIDRQGIVRLYNAGRMTREELEAAIRRVL
jgi:thiol-disulfide isomerase/thioredoxin